MRYCALWHSDNMKPGPEVFKAWFIRSVIVLAGPGEMQLLLSRKDSEGILDDEKQHTLMRDGYVCED